jgi:hypothetical protein
MSAMIPPQPAPAAAPQQPAFPTQEDVAQIQQATGFSPQKIMQDIQSTGARSADDLMATYSQQGGVDPSVLQGASGMSAPADPMSQAPPPVTASGPRGMAQAAMRGEPMPDESESAGEMNQEAMSPGAEMAEGIQPSVAMAAHSSRRPAPTMHRAMKGAAQHHASGKSRGRRV